MTRSEWDAFWLGIKLGAYIVGALGLLVLFATVLQAFRLVA
jgi:hypothetical protein